MPELPAGYEIRHGMVFVRAPCLLVLLPLPVRVAGIRSGKAWRRHGTEQPGTSRLKAHQKPDLG